MKKLISLIALAVIVMSVAAVAVQPENDGNGVGNPDNECQDFGFDFGIAKYECDDGDWDLSEEGEKEGYDTSATGSCDEVDWTSNPAADGVLEKAGLDYFVHAGGTSGTITQSGQHEISHITLCGNEQEIPEFGGIAAGLALSGAGIGYLMLRRRN